jgi:hypothetical protein
MLLGPLLTRVALRSANLYPCQPCSGSLQALIPAADDRNEEGNTDRYLRPTGIGGHPQRLKPPILERPWRRTDLHVHLSKLRNTFGLLKDDARVVLGDRTHGLALVKHAWV